MSQNYDCGLSGGYFANAVCRAVGISTGKTPDAEMGISSFANQLTAPFMEGVLYPLQPPARRRAPDKHMEVLCLGLSRSGTDSLRNALMILGYDDVYHGFVLTQRQREDCAFWAPLMRRKFAGHSLRGTDFDTVLASCEAVTDGPTNVFGEELMQFYPDAKVILNRRRDMDTWYTSMQNTCMQAFSWPMWVFGWFDTGLTWLWWTFWLVMHGYYHGDFEKHGKTVAKQHYEKLENALAEQQREYLDWSVDEGW